MAVDRYTRVILTVIAACLVWLSVGGSPLVPPVTAQAGDRVILAGWEDARGNTRRFPLVFSDDNEELSRNSPRSLPIWQMNKE